MDLSKLPKLSGNKEAPATPAAGEPAPPGDSPAPEAPVPYAGRTTPRPFAPPSPGPDAFLSLVIGAVLMMIGRGFAEWLMATLAGRAYDTGVGWETGPKAGQAVTYWELSGYTAVSESTVFIFGLALVVEAVVILTARMLPRAWGKLMFGSLLLTLLATAYNAVAIIILFSDGRTPIMATLLTGLGAYAVWNQWRLLRYGAAGQ